MRSKVGGPDAVAPLFVCRLQNCWHHCVELTGGTCLELPKLYILVCRINDIEAKYYADSEDAYDMRKQLKIKSEKSAGTIGL